MQRSLFSLVALALLCFGSLALSGCGGKTEEAETKATPASTNTTGETAAPKAGGAPSGGGAAAPMQHMPASIKSQ